MDIRDAAAPFYHHTEIQIRRTMSMKQSNLSRLMGYAGKMRILTYLSWILSAVSALIALVPFWYIWRLLREVLEVAPQF